MNRVRISYKEVKKRQEEDLRACLMENNIYRHFSSPFTYLLLRLGITPNKLTISFIFLCLLGGILLSLGTYVTMLIGMLIFLLFKILDDSDGEVARIQKSYSIEGVFIDRTTHYINSLCLGLGMGVGLHSLYKNEIYTLIGIAFTFAIIIEQVIIDVFKSTVRKKVINESFNKAITKERVSKIETNIMVNEFHSFSEQSIFLKLFSVYPLQGLLSGDRFYTLIISILILGEYLLSVFGFQFMHESIMFGLVPIYLLLISVSKIIWIIGFIYRLERTRYITNF